MLLMRMILEALKRCKEFVAVLRYLSYFVIALLGIPHYTENVCRRNETLKCITLLLPFVRTTLNERESDTAAIDIHDSGDGYCVHIRLSDKGEFESSLAANLLCPWTSSADTGRDGQRLFDALFANGKLREAWGAMHGSYRIHLRLGTQTPELHALPWELLHDGRTFIAADANTPFSRYLDVPQSRRGLIVERPIRVLAAISNPTDLADRRLVPLNVDAERQCLETAFADMPSSLIALEVLDGPVTLERLTIALSEHHPHILHLIAHGVFKGKHDQADIYLQDRVGKTHVVSDADFAGIFVHLGQDCPHLIFLAVCESATRSTVDAFAGVAPKLVQAGIPAVVAMQDRVAFTSTHVLAPLFYKELFRHGEVDRALNAARRVLLADKAPDVGVPVLLMRLEDGRLWDNSPTHAFDHSGNVHNTPVDQAQYLSSDSSHAISTPSTELPREALLDAIHQAGAELRAYPNEIAGIHIVRPEVNQIVDWVLNAESKERLGMLIDKPGGGKTVVMQEVLMRLEELEVFVLPIKGDTLSGVKDPTDLARRLGLPASVEQCAKDLGDKSLFVVLMDQLDALSLSLSADQATLDVLLSMLSRLQNFPNVRILASCRLFDLNNDPRLSNIKTEKLFKLQPLNEIEVDRVLKRIGIDGVRLLPNHRDLLTVPQHLKTYVQAVANQESQTLESFHTLQGLYGALWQRYITKPLPNTSDSLQPHTAIYRLVDEMHARRRLTVPAVVLDEYGKAAEYLQHTGFIHFERENWSFTHQTLFDYCYARRFVAGGTSLSQEILGGLQGLFERSQMLQILAYLRGTDETTYYRELKSLLFAEDLRIHLLFLVIDWLGALMDPTDEEFGIAKRLLGDINRRARFFWAVGGNVKWFDLLNGDVLPKLMENEDEQFLNVVIGFLGTMIQTRSDAVLARLRSYLGRDESWDARIADCLSRIQTWQSEDALNMLVDLFHRGRMTMHEQSCLHSLAKSNPAAGCRALLAYLDYRLAELVSEGQTKQQTADSSVQAYLDGMLDHFSWNQKLLGEYAIDLVMDAASQNYPEAIVEYLLPWFVRAVEILTQPYEVRGSYPSDAIFVRGWYGEHLEKGARFARHIAEALAKFAQAKPSEFRVVASELAHIERLAIQRVLAWAYLSDPQMYADDIFDYLIGDPRRLNIGETLESPRYDSCRLYGAAFRYIDANRRSVLEKMILDLRPEREPPQSHGITQLRFLKSVSRDLLSDTAQDRLGVLQRKFPDFRLTVPGGMATLAGIGSPIEESSLLKMSDGDWLKAMREYDESTDWGMPREEALKGGIVELSRSFSKHVRDDPDRFYALTLRFDETIPLHYVEAAISGLADSDIYAECIFDVVRQFFLRITGRFRDGVCQALIKCSKRVAVPNDLLDLMGDWAINDPDPGDGVWPEIQDGDERPNSQRFVNDPYTSAINSVRGVAIEAVCACALSYTPTQTERAFLILEQAAEDKSTAVRAGVIGSLGPLLQENAVRCLVIFETALDGHPRLIQSDEISRFLYWVYRDHFLRIRPFLENMLRNPDSMTRQAGARLVCLAGFHYPETQDLVDQVMHGDIALRRGAAQVYARNLSQKEVQNTCATGLCVLMNDSDDRVRSYVGECFTYLDPEDIDDLLPFIEPFINSPALLDGIEHFLKYLTSVVTSIPSLALLTMNRILDLVGNEITDMRTSVAIIEPYLVRLSLAIYKYMEDPEIKSQALAAFERLLVLGSRTANQALQDEDRK